MADFERLTKIIRVKAKDANGVEDDEVYLDIEQTIAFIAEVGSGVDFQRRKYTLDYQSPERKTSKLKVYNPDDNSQFIEIDIYDAITIESGSGVDYQRATLKFDNTAGNERREVRTDRIYHRDIAEADIDKPAAKQPIALGDASVDTTQKVDVEVITAIQIEQGAGLDFQRSLVPFSTDNIPGARETLT